MKRVASIIGQAVVIIVISAAIGIILNAFHPRGYVMVGRSKISEKKIVYISTAEAKIKYDFHSAIFIDSRTPGEFAAGHIEGSVNIPSSPASVMMKAVEEYSSLINEPRELVLYCTGSSCDSSDVLAAELLGLGYSRTVYIIDGGFPQWSSSGYPVSTE